MTGAAEPMPEPGAGPKLQHGLQGGTGMLDCRIIAAIVTAILTLIELCVLI